MRNVVLRSRSICVTQCIAKAFDSEVDAFSLLHAIEAIKEDPNSEFKIGNESVRNFLEKNNFIQLNRDNVYSVKPGQLDNIVRLSDDLDKYLTEEIQEIETLFNNK